MLKVGIYIRVSTIMQAVDGYSLDAQRHNLSDFCKGKGYDIYDCYADEGISGKDVNHRAELLRLLADVQAGKVNIVVVWALSRLTRSVADLYDIWGVCNKYNADIISMTEPFDTSTPIGRAMMGLLGIFAQMERELTAERVRAAMLERAMQGKRTASSVLGYDRDGVDSLRINPQEAAVVQYIYDKYVEHKSLSAVAELCNLRGFRGKRGQPFSPESIKRIVTRPIYIGYYSFNGKLYKGNFELFISESLYKKANIIINRYK